jgi:hypothetical protein
MDTHAPDSPEIVLERLEASIEEALHRLIDGGRIDNRHREAVEGFRRRLAALRQRLAARRERGAAEMPADARSDFDLLAWDYKRWLAEIDKDFETRTGYETGLGRGAPG